MNILMKVAVLGAMSGLVSACAEHTQTSQTSVSGEKQERMVTGPRTVKPGAGLTFSHEFQFEPEVNRDGIVAINIRNGHGDGMLELTARGTDGIEVLPSSSTETVVLAGQPEIDWDISYRPNELGVGFLNINAVVTSAAGQKLSRSYSVRITTGEVTEKNASMTGGELIPIEETIE